MRCLNSVKSFVDEIIIVDTGSWDNTKKVASEYTDKVFDFEWVDDFSAARNFSFSKATMDYILWLDSDDIILPEDAVRFARLKNEPCGADAVMMKYNVGFDDSGKVTFSFYRERLVKRNSGFLWKEPVHEYLAVYGRTVTSDVCVSHRVKEEKSDGRNLLIYENRLKNGLSPRGKYYYARELKDNRKYAEAADAFRAFLSSGEGWVEDIIAACGELAKCLFALNKSSDALESLFKSFEFDTPRPEICCQLGYYFKNRGRFKQAVYWFERALARRDKAEAGFCQEQCNGFIPSIELALCHGYLGDMKKAYAFNEIAAKFNPDSPEVVHNKNYLKSISEESSNVITNVSDHKPNDHRFP